MFIDNFRPASIEFMGNTSSSPVQKCLSNAVGKDVAYKSDPLFQLSHVKPYNLDTPSVPAAVTYPKTTDQIAKVVKYAVENSLKVQPRCDGNSYANYGEYSCAADDLGTTKFLKVTSNPTSSGANANTRI
jgi:hypothetical protein